MQNEKTKYAKAWRQDSQDWVLIPTRDPVELKLSVPGQGKQVMSLQEQELHVEGLGTQERGLEFDPKDKRELLQEIKQGKGWVIVLGRSLLLKGMWRGEVGIEATRSITSCLLLQPGQGRGRMHSSAICPPHSTQPSPGQCMFSTSAEWQIRECLVLHREKGYLSFTILVLKMWLKSHDSLWLRTFHFYAVLFVKGSASPHYFL